jgi:hypothetical protein
MVLVNDPACRSDPSRHRAIQPEISFLKLSPKEKYPHEIRKYPIQQYIKKLHQNIMAAPAGKGLK